ncbi:MAG: acyltransferase family protein [Lachnoclostridium sp.]|nr:acyltransferase family protein [Lachnoclostridium sp.]
MDLGFCGLGKDGMESLKSTDRTVYFDYLRVFAAFAMMIVHISAQNWYVADVNSFEWQMFNFFDSIVRWGVPVFVMISGSLFLSRDIPQKKIFSKYVLRMATSFMVWSFIYTLFSGGGV